MRGTILQINISSGGVPKRPVFEADVHELGIAGDKQRNTKYHGGPRKALLLIASEVIDSLRDEGWPLFYGALGENLTTYGIDHRLWRPGQRFRAGSAIIELTQPRQPCHTLDPYGPGIQTRLFDQKVKKLDPSSSRWGMSGFYASVVQPGRIVPMDIIESVDS